MNLEQSQLTHEEAKASLGLSTRLIEQMLVSQAQPPEAPTSPENAPEQELELETQESPQIDPETLKNELKEELGKDLKKIIRSEIKKLLDEEDGEKTETSEDAE